MVANNSLKALTENLHNSFVICFPSFPLPPTSIFHPGSLCSVSLSPPLPLPSTSLPSPLPPPFYSRLSLLPFLSFLIM